MKDNDLLVTELYRDPTEDAITALSVYLTPKTSTETLTLLLIQLLQGVSFLHIPSPGPPSVNESGKVLFFMFLQPSHTSPVCSGDSGNWIEIAYGTSSGTVRVIVQHPETVGSGPQLFQTFSVHRSPVTKIMLSEKHLISGTRIASSWKLAFCVEWFQLMSAACS